MSRLQILMIDNKDSFTFNLVDEFARRGAQVDVWRNTASVSQIEQALAQIEGPKMLMISPGPGTPQEAGCCLKLTDKLKGTLPIFGVCLGHQIIIQALGGTIVGAPEIVHGKRSLIHHNNASIFAGLDNPLPVARYHSLAGGRIPKTLDVIAEFDGMPMAVAHRTQPLLGLQFHPESILTLNGGRLIDKLMDWGIRK